jgi:hypothetical protein
MSDVVPTLCCYMMFIMCIAYTDVTRRRPALRLVVGVLE